MGNSEPAALGEPAAFAGKKSSRDSGGRTFRSDIPLPPVLNRSAGLPRPALRFVPPTCSGGSLDPSAPSLPAQRSLGGGGLQPLTKASRSPKTLGTRSNTNRSSAPSECPPERDRPCPPRARDLLFVFLSACHPEPGRAVCDRCEGSAFPRKERKSASAHVAAIFRWAIPNPPPSSSSPKSPPTSRNNQSETPKSS